jgi:hypothetical protein
MGLDRSVNCTCDRCGRREVVNGKQADAYSTGWLRLIQPTGEASATGPTSDFCPDCAASFRAWMSAIPERKRA